MNLDQKQRDAVECGDGPLLIVAGPGSGKCLLPQMQVEVNSELLPLSEIWDRYASCPSREGSGYIARPKQQISVPSLNPKTGGMTRGSVVVLYRQKVREKVRRITFGDGSVVECTKAHKFFDGQKWTSDIKESDVLALPRCTPHGNRQCDLELADFTGWMVGEGYEAGHGLHLISITQSDPAVLRRLRRILLWLFARYKLPVRNVRIVKDKRFVSLYKMEWSSAPFVRFLARRGYVYGARSAGKRVPLCVMRASSHAVQCFLRSIFDAEAWVEKVRGTIGLTTASLGLCEELRILLRRFGVWTRKRRRRVRLVGWTRARSYWELSISGPSLRTFAERIGFGLKRKQSALLQCADRLCNPNRDLLPSSVIQDLAIKTGFSRRRFYSASDYISGKRMSREFYRSRMRTSLLALAGSVGMTFRGNQFREPQKVTGGDAREIRHAVQVLDWIYGSDLVFDSVKLVEEFDYEGWVYDLTVRRFHNFVAGGVICHNTRVLVHRVAHMITFRGIPANKILLTTFTKKAAEEMRERLRGLIGSAADDLWLGTVHSRCLEVLRKGGPEKVGLPKNFTVSGDDDSKKLAETVAKQVATELAARDSGQHPDDVSAIAVTDAMERHGLETMHSRISYAKEWNEGPDDVAANPEWKPAAREAYARYNDALRKSGKADFGDLQMLTVKMLEDDPEVLAWVRGRFQYVLVDEFQDTNAIQAKLFRLICEQHRNLTVVGDADQSIFSWRGAVPTFMLHFEKEWPGAKVVRLDQNYRSTRNVVAAANGVILNNTGRFLFEPRTENAPGPLPQMVRTLDQITEADWIADRVRFLHDKQGVAYNEMAVLYRTHRQSHHPETAFRAARLPYEVIGGTPFFARREVQDLLAWLTILVNPKDRDSFRRAMFAPPRGVGDITLRRFFASLDESGCDAVTHARNGMLIQVQAKQRRAIREFGDLIVRFQKEVDDPDLLSIIARDTKYATFLHTQEGGLARQENVEELCGLYAAFDPPDEASRPLAFLDWAATELQRTEARDRQAGASVSMMTMHAAKGSEFDTVFIVGCVDGITPSFRAESEEDLEEERRLFYVAMTRAKQRLYMLVPAQRVTMMGETQPTQPSQFLYEAADGGAEWTKGTL